MKKINYFQAIGPLLPLEKDIELCAYSLWEEAGKPHGISNHFWYKAENLLQDMANRNFESYLKYLYKLRGNKL